MTKDELLANRACPSLLSKYRKLCGRIYSEKILIVLKKIKPNGTNQSKRIIMFLLPQHPTDIIGIASRPKK